MFYVLEVPNGPSYFQEHCYTEIVEVYDKICVTQIPETCSQLQNAYLFRHIGTFDNESKALNFVNEYKNKRDNPQLISSPATPSSQKKQNETDNKNKWYGNGNVAVV